MNNIIKKTRIFIKKYMNNLNDISHDYSHINEVIKLSLKIAKSEGILNKKDLFYIKMGALLHDYEDSKYSNNSQSFMINQYLKKHKELTSFDRLEIVKLASNISLSKELIIHSNINNNQDNNNMNQDNNNDMNEDNNNNDMNEDNNNEIDKSDIKLYIIRDADRINSLGAIGIMRYISYNIKNSKKPSFSEIIENMKRRTNKIKRYIRTKEGKRIAKKHIKLIDNFIKNYELFTKKKYKI